MKTSPLRGFCWPALVCGFWISVSLASCSSTAATNGGHPLPLVTYHGDNARTGYSADSSITPSNAGALRQRWSTEVGTSLSNQPAVDNGIVYWGDWKGEMHATSVT
ncbi:MAG: PQQ-binding-like beta-propeller repeat protein, partial [Acidimicrobiales bacterium]